MLKQFDEKIIDTAILEEILQELQVEKEIFLTNTPDNDPYNHVLRIAINTFVNCFFYPVVEIKSLHFNSLEEIYVSYIKSRNSLDRYLLELYLTITYFLNLEEDKKNTQAYVFLLGNKISIYGINKRLLNQQIELELDTSSGKDLVNLNEKNYKLMLQKYGKLTEELPEEIGKFLNEDGKTKSIKQIKQEYGITLMKHNKPVYMDVILNNPFIPEYIKTFLLEKYPLLSLDIHPTPASMIDFELFIEANESDKKNIALIRNNDSVLLLSFLGKSILKTLKLQNN